VHFGLKAYASRYRDGRVRSILECNGDWVPKHGLQRVFAHDSGSAGSAFDGNPRHADACADSGLEEAVYPH
jgi:hypothetical protein